MNRELCGEKRTLECLARISLLAVLVTVGSGCCRSAKEADQAQAELLVSNRERAEPLMRAAARAVGAELLQALPERTLRIGSCTGARLSPGRACATWVSGDRRAFRWTDGSGPTSIGVRISSPAWQYARVARRANTLVLLVPVVTRHAESKQTRCECYGHSSGYYDLEQDLESVFLIGDLPLEGVLVVNVPIVEDFIPWKCATFVIPA
jgi:hypothetical protein